MQALIHLQICFSKKCLRIVNTSMMKSRRSY
ncbi:TPA: hypothetical protein N0F65_005943 [Lagenidium giganteum]|uniref:Ribosomal protein L36 n=1 Tax=Lagenidium giganteum TaxID=4803 RepID=A0AAV2Z9B7_9STRA|nr:TPA: hypothetical protein N0F65_005943 [Lagenidium giganteum]